MSSSIPDEIPETATLPQMWRIAKYWKIEALDFTNKYWRAMEDLDASQKQLKQAQETNLELKEQLTATQEWLIKASRPLDENGAALREMTGAYRDLEHQNRLLKERVSFLERAERLKIWNEKTGEWEVRFSIQTDGRPVQQ